MSRFSALLLTSAVALSSTVLISSPAKAVERYGLVCIYNPTQLNITYLTHRGKGNFTSTTLGPEQSEMHWWEFKYANQDSTPRLYIKFDSQVGSQQFDIRYQLPVGAVPTGTAHMEIITNFNMIVSINRPLISKEYKAKF